VLSGGGARGAYEVGVLRYVREKLRVDTRFDVITGTSVGAINGAYLAATCDRPRAQARMLQRVWSDLTIDNVYHFGWEQLRNLPTAFFGKNLPKISHGGRVGGLVDARYLEKIVRTQIPWAGITENLRQGKLSAFACTATELATGICTTFVQNTGNDVAPLWAAAYNEAVVPTTIAPAHALASAAIPGLFPAVRVNDHFFVDGMLRQNTPLRPAIRLGANRLLIVALDHVENAKRARERKRERDQFVFPNAFFLLGKTLNALMLDRMEVDMVQIRRLNQLIDAGKQLYGEDFANRISSEMHRQEPFREVKLVVIQPSHDLSQIAWDVVRRTGLRHYSGLTARLIRRSMDASREFEAGENDFASYVLFDPTYLREVIELGYSDAQANHDDLIELFDRSEEPHKK